MTAQSHPETTRDPDEVKDAPTAYDVVASGYETTCPRCGAEVEGIIEIPRPDEAIICPACGKPFLIDGGSVEHATH